jgi:hypothetical protein
MSRSTLLRPIGSNEIDGDTFGEGMGQHPTVSMDKEIGNGWVTPHLIVEKFLKGNPVVYKNLVSSLQSYRVRQVLRLGFHRVEKAAAMAL